MYRYTYGFLAHVNLTFGKFIMVVQTKLQFAIHCVNTSRRIKPYRGADNARFLLNHIL